jgi:hypothetical protein
VAKDILRELNFGIPLGEILHGTSKSFGNRGRKSHTYNYKYEYQMVETNPRLSFIRGDVVLFNNTRFFPIWKRNNFAVVIDRYRLVKYKGITTYRDYCLVLMMITGDKKGRTFKMSGNHQGKISKMAL